MVDRTGTIIKANLRIGDVPYNDEEKERFNETIDNIMNLIIPYKPLLNYTV